MLIKLIFRNSREIKYKVLPIIKYQNNFIWQKELTINLRIKVLFRSVLKEKNGISYFFIYRRISGFSTVYPQDKNRPEQDGFLY